MPKSESHGVTINYDIEGQGPPLVLVHGFSGNRNSWRGYGFVDPLKTEYQLILIDARGHGESSKPHDPDAYDYRLLVDDVIAVIDDLNLTTVSYLGYSMGGTIGFGLGKYYPQRVQSLIVGGCSPFNRTDPTEPSPMLDLYEQAADQGVELIIDTFKIWFGSITPEYEARLRNADVRAAAAQLRWMQDHSPDYGNDLSAMTMPFLIYIGEADEPAEAQECATRLPNATFVMLPGLNHVQAAGASELLVPHIKTFLAETL